MSAEKLPEWPEHIAGPTTDAIAALLHQTRLASAALARMEALVELIRELDSVALGASDYDVSLARELASLLAACERKEAGR